jgi:hypothetical protein
VVRPSPGGESRFLVGAADAWPDSLVMVVEIQMFTQVPTENLRWNPSVVSLVSSRWVWMVSNQRFFSIPSVPIVSISAKSPSLGEIPTLENFAND